MPPVPLEYQGRERIARFLSVVPADGDLRRFRLVATRANGQPAFGMYIRDPQCPIAHATGILVLTLEGERIAALTAFHDTGVFPLFGLPRTLPRGLAAARRIAPPVAVAPARAVDCAAGRGRARVLRTAGIEGAGPIGGGRPRAVAGWRRRPPRTRERDDEFDVA